MPRNPVESGFYCDNAKKARLIFEEHGSFILGVLESQVGIHDAQDLYQNLYTSILTHPIPDSIKNIKSYLYRAAVNDVIDFKRKKSNQILRINEYSEHLRADRCQDDPANITELKDIINHTFKIIEENLPEKICRSLKLKLRNQLDYREISEEMGIKIDTVKKYVYRGLKNAQAILKTEE